jgi:peptidoglycan/xylan/chitin deacetylase (PgdA/CDA1 family)
MYHDVEPDNPDVYAVTPERFREHLDAIAATGCGAPSRADALAAGTGGWALTFDDGGISALAVAEELTRRGWVGHFFIAVDYVGRPISLDWDGVRAVARMGHVIGSHSCSHPDRMADQSWEQLLDEWSRSATALADALGEPVTTASVPGGLYSTAVGRAAAQAGYTILFNSLPTQRVSSVDGTTLIGRYAVRRDTDAAEAAAAASGATLPWARQSAAWRLRGAVKKVAGPRYESMRRALLARR